MIEINKVVWISTICISSRTICDNRGPEVVCWVLDVTNRILPSYHPDTEISCSTWESSPLIASSHGIA